MHIWESKHAYRKWPERVWMRTWAVIHKTLSRSEVSAQLRNKNRARHRVGNALSQNAGSTKWRLHWIRIRIRLQEYVVYSNVDETSRSWSLLLDQWGFVHDVYISYYFLFSSLGFFPFFLGSLTNLISNKILLLYFLLANNFYLSFVLKRFKISKTLIL